MTDHVVLGELQHEGVVRHLDQDSAAGVEATGLVEVRPEGAGRWRLRPNGRVGAARVGDLDVQVRPKIDIGRLLFLLSYAADPGFRTEDASGAVEPDLWPALAGSLARHAERALAHGALHGYVTVEDSLPLVRGRVRMADQLAARPGLMMPLEVSYDAHVVDIAENQILRSAVRYLAAVPGLAGELRTRLTHLDRLLTGATILPLPARELPAWRRSRLNAHYVPALRLAELVLRHQSTEPAPGGLVTAAFVVSMHRVFEDFVTAALREAFSAYPGHTSAQHDAFLDEQQTVAIRPDVVQFVRGRPVAVLDAKYKLADPAGGLPNADTYQLLAYCTALQVRAGWLVYAYGGAGGTRKVRHSSVEIDYLPLDLTAAPAELLAQVAELAREVYDRSAWLPALASGAS